MRWAFRILAGLNLALLAVALFYSSPGEDPAGRAMRLSFAFFYALALGVVLPLYRFINIAWVRAPLLGLLALAPLAALYGLYPSL